MRPTHQAGLALALAAAALAPAAAHADVTLTDGPATVVYGNVSSYDFAETFVVPTTASVLESYTVSADSDGAGAFRTQIVAWDGQPVRPSLFNSSFNALTGPLTAFTTQTGGLALTPGGTYAILSNTGGRDQTSNIYLGATTAPFPDSSYFYNSVGGPLSGHYEGITDKDYRQALTLDFSAAPEPSQFGALGAFALGLGGLLLRARRARSAPPRPA